MNLPVFEIKDTSFVTSVSFDGNVLYLPFLDSELKDIALAIFGEGTFSIVARKDLDADVKITPLENAPITTNSPSLTYHKFQYDKHKPHVIRFKKPCSN